MRVRIPVPTRKRLFLAALQKTGSISEACRCVGWSRPSAYGWRAVDSVFAESWDQAIVVAVAELEQEALRLVAKAYPPSKLSAPFVERLLKLHRPELYSKHATKAPQQQTTDAQGLRAV